MNTINIKSKLMSLLFLTFGSVIFAAGIHFFRVPNNFIVGGASGLSIIFARLLPGITVGQFVTGINAVCIVFGLAVLGRSFSWKTVYCSLVYSVAILTLEKLYVISLPLTDEAFLELIFSVILCGIGAGLVIYAGGSTGGIEIFALMAKEKTRFSVGNALLLFNLTIVIFSAGLFGIKTCLFSILGVLIHSIIVDKVIQILNSASLLLIITQKESDVCQYINNDLSECATVMNSVGSFKNTDNKFILVVLENKKAAILKKQIKVIDNNAFVIGMTTFETIGGKGRKFV